MPEGAFFEPRRISPTSLAIVILLHGAAVTALALSKMQFERAPPRPPLEIELIPDTPDPPPEPIEKTVESTPARPTEFTYPERIVALPQPPDIDLFGSEGALPPLPGDRDRDLVIADPPGPALPPAPPVRIKAKIDSGSILQPPYPSSEQLAGRNGVVRIRVVIGIGGRVKSTEKVSATSDAFYRATERHALRAWRFEPATVDGKPIESRQVLVVNFQITD